MKSIAEQMNDAVAAFSRGDLKTALKIGEAALQRNQQNAAILQFLGVVSCAADDPKRGAAFFRQAIKRGADTADNRLNLAKALLAQGLYDEALAQCEGPVADASPDLQRVRADILKAAGRGEDALWLYESITVQKPDDFEAWNNLGNARHERGDLEGALTALERAKALNPKSSLVHVNLARVLASMDRYQDAALTMEQAALLAPEDPAPLLELGKMLIALDHVDGALRALGTAARLDSKNPQIFAAIGMAFSDLDQPVKAEQAYRFALQAASTSPTAYLDLGVLLEKANRVSELETLIVRAEGTGVSGPAIDYLRALALSRGGQHEAALEIVRGIDSPLVHPAMRAQFIGQLADRLGHIDEAYRAFEDMNRIMAETPLGASVDRTAYRRDIDGLAEKTTAEWFAAWPPAPPPSRPSPAFLVGFPRSGTTLLDTMLMGHDATHVMEEIPILEELSKEIGGFDAIAGLDGAAVARLRARYFEEVDRRSPGSAGKLIIDKNPLSMIRVPLIHRLFPDAKIILAMRHPCDVVLSCYMQNFKPTEAMSSFLDLDNAARAYDRIFAYWEKCAGLFPIDVHMLRYEAMVADSEAELRPVIAFLGLDWQGGVLDHRETAAARGHIRTPSYAQVTEKVYDRASGRWRRYEAQMRWTLPILEPWARHFGYGALTEPA